MSSSTEQLRIVLIGKTGNGKSSTGNSLLHSRTAFHSTQSAQSITKDCQAGTAKYTDEYGSEKQLLVVDTPGFFDTDKNISNQMVQGKIASQIFPMTSPGVHAFLIILRVDRFTPEEKNTVDFIKTIFGAGAAKYCIVIFTRLDQLEEGQTLNEFINSSPELQEFVNVCGNRKLAINNKLTGQPLKTITQQLLKMIREMVNNNNGTYYTNAEYQRIEQQRREEQRRREQEELARKKAYEESLIAKTREDERRRANELAQKVREEEQQKAQRRIKEAEEARRQAEEARRRAEEQARRQAEEQAQRYAEDARRRAEEQARRDAEDARRRAEEQARRQAEEQAQRYAEDARRRAEEQAQRYAEDARRRAEEQARRDAEMARMQSMRFESQPVYCCPTPAVYNNNNDGYDPLGQLFSQIHIGSAMGPRTPMSSMNTGSGTQFIPTRSSGVESGGRYGGRFTGEHMVTRGAANARPIYEGARGGLYHETASGNRVYLRK